MQTPQTGLLSCSALLIEEGAAKQPDESGTYESDAVLLSRSFVMDMHA